MDAYSAQAFVNTWAEAWNTHDLEAILQHFADDAVFASPVAAQLLPDSDGVVRGKTALRDYWAEGLRRIPDLHFDVVGFYVGVGVLVVNYRNQIGRMVNEVLLFGADGFVTHGYGTYLSDAKNQAGAER